MDELLQQFSSPAWWASTVIVAFIINIGSSYFKPWLDNRLVNVSATRRRAAEERDQRFKKALEAFWMDDNAIINAKLDRTNYYLRTIVFVAIALIASDFAQTLADTMLNPFFFLLVNSFALTCSGGALIFALTDLSKASEINEQLTEHYKKIEGNSVLSLAEKRRWVLEELYEYDSLPLSSDNPNARFNGFTMVTKGELEERIRTIDNQINDELKSTRSTTSSRVRRILEEQNSKYNRK